MSTLFLITYVVLWIITAALVVLVVLLYRQFGLMVMPGGRRVNLGGLDIGARAPSLLLRLENRQELVYDWRGTGYADWPYDATCAVFGVPMCPICDSLVQEDANLELLATRHPSTQFLWVDSADAPRHALPANWVAASSAKSEAHRAMDIPNTPFMYVVATDGRILAKGLVNQISDIEGRLAPAPVPLS